MLLYISSSPLSTVDRSSRQSIKNTGLEHLRPNKCIWGIKSSSNRIHNSSQVYMDHNQNASHSKIPNKSQQAKEN